MLVGPVFRRELVTTPRRSRHFVLRSVYVASLLVLMCTAWLLLAGTQVIRNVGDLSRFGALLFQILAPFQLAVLVFLGSLGAASAVAQEKDRRTLILLLMTRLSNYELVLGKLAASLLNVLVMVVAGLPVFMLVTLFGGVSFEQVWRVFSVTLFSILLGGSLGSTFALWREKTFQTLSMTALSIVIWVGVWEAVHAGVLGEFWNIPAIGQVSCHEMATGFSPVRAILASSRPMIASDAISSFYGHGVGLFLVVSMIGTVLLNVVAIFRVRAWNPSREIRPGQQMQASEESVSLVSGEADFQNANTASHEEKAEVDRAGHVDSIGRTQKSARNSRVVWDNPILWREIKTRAYGRKMIVIRLAYLIFFAMAVSALIWSIMSGEALARVTSTAVLPVASKPLAPFILVSFVIVNALSVTSITNERDGLSLDLLLVTDLSPREFVFGKLGGVLWVTKEMILCPLGLCVYLRWSGGLTTENFIFLLGGLATLYLFVAMLGIHCGMAYANSRTAIGVSLGTVFFLFLGIAVCIMIMISFSGSFQRQLLPFLSLILGGGAGLYFALGARNPSSAILVASICVPFLTFVAITSFVLRDQLTVFLVSVGAYGFTIAAMMMPAIFEFDIAMGRSRTVEED
ncbi:MAG: hypothetical protein MK165_20730 [Pirellulaceae bacterium]|nr:hypothetical protein [Pirellulaceae bacterium]